MKVSSPEAREKNQWSEQRGWCQAPAYVWELMTPQEARGDGGERNRPLRHTDRAGPEPVKWCILRSKRKEKKVREAEHRGDLRATGAVLMDTKEGWSTFQMTVLLCPSKQIYSWHTRNETDPCLLRVIALNMTINDTNKQSLVDIFSLFVFFRFCYKLGASSWVHVCACQGKFKPLRCINSIIQ